MADAAKTGSRTRTLRTSWEVGDCVSVPPIFFGQDYSATVPSFINKIIGRVEQVHTNRLSVQWDGDRLVQTVSMDKVTKEPRDTVTQYIGVDATPIHFESSAITHRVITEDDFQPADQSTSGYVKVIKGEKGDDKESSDVNHDTEEMKSSASNNSSDSSDEEQNDTKRTKLIQNVRLKTTADVKKKNHGKGKEKAEPVKARKVVTRKKKATDRRRKCSGSDSGGESDPEEEAYTSLQSKKKVVTKRKCTKKVEKQNTKIKVTIGKKAADRKQAQGGEEEEEQNVLDCTDESENEEQDKNKGKEAKGKEKRMTEEKNIFLRKEDGALIHEPKMV